MKEEHVKCLLCAADAPEFVRKVKSLYSDDFFNLVRCKKCGLIYINPWEDWSEKEERLKSREDDRGFREAETTEVDTYRQVLRELSGYRTSGRLLDIGCGAGGFLRLARDAGWEARGVEINRSIAQSVSRRYGLDIFGGTVREAAFPPGSFDVVVTINTLEHIHQPVQFGEEIYKILKPGGLFYCMTPNYHNFLVRFAQRFGALADVDPIDPTGHPCIYSPATLACLLEKCGFKAIKIRAGMTGRVFAKRGILGRLGGKLLGNLLGAVTNLTGGGSVLRAVVVKPN